MSTISLTTLSKDIILKEQYTLAGFKFYLETLYPEYNNLLLESSNKDILLEGLFSKTLDKISSFAKKNKVRDFFYDLGRLFRLEPSSEFKKLFGDSLEAIKKYNITPQQIQQILSKSEKINEEITDDDIYTISVSDASGNEKTFDLRKTISVDDVNLIRARSPVLYKNNIKQNIDPKTGIYNPPNFDAEEKKAAEGIQIIQRLVNWMKNKLSGKIFKSAFISLMGAAALGIPIAKIDIAADNAEAARLEADNLLNKYLQDSNTPESLKAVDDAAKVNVTLDGKPLSSLANEPNTVVKFIPFDYGKGMKASATGEKIMADTNELVKKIAEENPNAEITIKVTGTVSHSTGDVKLGTDTKMDLDQARQQTTAKALNDTFKDNPNIKVVEKSNPPDAYKDQTKAKDSNSKEGAGAAIEISVKGKMKPVAPPDKWPEYAEFPNVLAPSNVEKPIRPKGGETPKGAEKTFDVSDAPPSGTTSKSIELVIPPAPTAEFSKLNRNGQIATVLASINPKLNIGQYKELGSIRSYTDRELLNPDIKDENAKELAKLIVNIRKNPNILLKKVSAATNIPLNVRAKAVSTSPSKSTQAQLQTPTVKESLELFQEAYIDDIFTKLGIGNEDINANKYKVISYLGSMYASEGDTNLSIVNTDQLNDEDKKQLQGLGFAPQAGNNYVFLKGQKKTQVKQQADVTRVFNAVNKNASLKNSLKRIGTKDELKNLIKAIISYTNEKFQQNASQIKTDLITIRNQYKAPAAASPIKEETQLNLPDVNAAVKLINSYSNLKAELDKINNRPELMQLLRGLISYFDPALLGRENDVKAAFQGAANSITNKALMPGSKKAVNEIKRMKKLAGLIK